MLFTYQDQQLRSGVGKLMLSDQCIQCFSSVTTVPCVDGWQYDWFLWARLCAWQIYFSLTQSHMKSWQLEFASEVVAVEQLTQVALERTVTALMLLHLHLGVGVGKWWCSPNKAATPRLAHHEGFGVELNKGGGPEGCTRDWAGYNIISIKFCAIMGWFVCEGTCI